MELTQLHILAGWGGMLGGALSGAIIGMFFHEQAWAGGYAAFRRRLMRLGHIAFFGIGFLNFMFAFTLPAIPLAAAYAGVASAGFLVAIVAMPLVCFLAAWQKPLRHLFFIPVLAVLSGIVATMLGGF